MPIMQVISFARKVRVKIGKAPYEAQVSCNAGSALIFDDDTAHSLRGNLGSSDFIYSCDDLRPFTESRPIITDWQNKRVLFYRNRGIGDQLIASALPRYFKDVLRADPRQLADPTHEPLWLHNSSIAGMAESMPITLDTVWRSEASGARPFFDKAFFFESVCEWDTNQEQENVYDRMFAMCGIDPATVAPKWKRPNFTLHPSDKKSARDFTKDQSYVFFSPIAKNSGRTLPIQTIKFVFEALAELAKKRSFKILCSADKPFNQCTDDLAFNIMMSRLMLETPNVIDISGRIPLIRLFAALIDRAMLVISPDSSSLHFAAAFEVPAVGIWGPFPPKSRVKYYARQVHLFHAEQCQNAPCFNYLPTLPANKCPDGAKQTHCQVFDGVKTQEILDAINELV